LRREDHQRRRIEFAWVSPVGEDRNHLRMMLVYGCCTCVMHVPEREWEEFREVVPSGNNGTALIHLVLTYVVPTANAV
jgi:hypothetical protein